MHAASDGGSAGWRRSAPSDLQQLSKETLDAIRTGPCGDGMCGGGNWRCPCTGSGRHAGQDPEHRQGGDGRARKLGAHGLCLRDHAEVRGLPRRAVREGAGPDRAQGQDRVHGPDLAEHHAPGAERHRGHRLRPDHQQPRAPKAGGLCRDHLREPGAHGRARRLGHHLLQAARRQARGGLGRHDCRAAAAQVRARQWREPAHLAGQGPFRELSDARIGPCRCLRAGRQPAGRRHRQLKNPAGFRIVGEVLGSGPSPSCFAATIPPSRRLWTTCWWA